jgi:mannose-6-phosphate isomerase-like protein (cupin superfamily)
MEKVNLVQRFSTIHDHWNPCIAGEQNGQMVKLVKFKGPFAWHHHEQEDEFFFLVKDRFVMELREGNIQLDAGEFLITPRGMEHRPNAKEEVEVLL